MRHSHVTLATPIQGTYCNPNAKPPPVEPVEPSNAASRKIDHIALPTKYKLITRQRASVDSKLLGRSRNVGYYHIFER